MLYNHWQEFLLLFFWDKKDNFVSDMLWCLLNEFTLSMRYLIFYCIFFLYFIVFYCILFLIVNSKLLQLFFIPASLYVYYCKNHSFWLQTFIIFFMMLWFFLKAFDMLKTMIIHSVCHNLVAVQPRVVMHLKCFTPVLIIVIIFKILHIFPVVIVVKLF